MWRNRYTRTFEGRVERSLRVQVPPSTFFLGDRIDFIKNKDNLLLLGIKVAFSIFITYLIIFGRCVYLITKFVALTFFLITISILQNYQSEYTSVLRVLFIFIIFSIGLFAASKRLRDIKWKQWLLLIWTIPLIGLSIGIPLLVIKSRQDA